MIERMENEQELTNICDLIRQIAAKAASSAEELEALKKAALALHMVCAAGLWAELTKRYGELDAPLTDAERAHLEHAG